VFCRSKAQRFDGMGENSRLMYGFHGLATIVQGMAGRHQISQRLDQAMAKGVVSITAERCKGCGFCVEFCPTKVLALSSAFNSKGYHPPYVAEPQKCSGCGLCSMYCPDFAIYGHKNEQKAKPEQKVEPASAVKAGETEAATHAG
jgi:2-oxoglutarate ferredoxin oxidoreductase subunit delta